MNLDAANIDPLWSLADLLSLQDAAALIAGYDPSDIHISHDDTNFLQNYPRLYPVEKALYNSVLSGSLEVLERVPEVIWVPDLSDPLSNCGSWETKDRISMTATLVKVEVLKSWLTNKGFKSGFFFPDTVNVPDFLDQKHMCYSPKLAAAIEAWRDVSTNPELIKGKTVKQALLTWLRKNADRFGLTKDDGNPNEQGIEEVAKIANWDTKGGAPRTPG